MIIDGFLQEIGMEKREVEIYKTALFYGRTSASVVAKRLDRERTSTYKIMKNMVKKGRFSHSKEHHTTFFEATSLSQLKQQFQKKLEQFQTIEQNLDEVEQEYDALLGQHRHSTKIAIFEGERGLENVYLQIQEQLETTGIISIKCFSSATLESLSGADENLKKQYANFLSLLKQKKITVESYLGKGISIMEQFLVSSHIDEIEDLPLNNNGTQIWIVGSVLYFMIFRNEPYIITLKSQELANLMHFIGEQLGENLS